MVLKNNYEVMENIICRNVRNLKELLVVDEKLNSYQQKNAKQYYISTILDEIQRFVFSLVRFEYCCKEDNEVEVNKEDEESKIVSKYIIDGMYYEMNLYHRKFIEILTNIILWKDRENEYFKYYFCFEELKALRYKVNDLEEFYSIKSLRLYTKIKEIRAIINNINNIDMDKCFFQHKCTNLNKKVPYIKEISFKDKLKLVIPICKSIDKQLLGFSYQFYSVKSDKIHFSIKNNVNSQTIIEDTITYICLIILRVISICAEMMKVSDLNEFNIEMIDRVINEADNAYKEKEPLICDRYSVDDYVYTSNEELGRIIDKKISSKYGYRSYKVHFIQDNKMNDEWFIAEEIKKYISFQEICNMLLMIGLKNNLKFKMDKSKEQLYKNIDNFMVIVWGKDIDKRITTKNIQEKFKTYKYIFDQ